MAESSGVTPATQSPVSTPDRPTETAETPVTLTATVPPPPDDPTETPTALPTATATPFVCPYLRGRLVSHSLESEAMWEDVRLLVYLPPCYDQFPDKAYPVLYLFHGWPLNEHHWDNLGVDEWSDDWISRGLMGPLMIVMPGVSSDGLYVNSSGGPGSFEGMVVDELVPFVDATYRTWRDPVGRAVGGISRGGVWALEIGMRHQDLFSIIGGHSPALALNRPLPQYDPFLLADEDVSDLRFYLDGGNADWARAGAIRLRDKLLSVDADVTYEVHDGGHVDELWRGAVPDYLAFYTATWPPRYSALPWWGPPVGETP